MKKAVVLEVQKGYAAVLTEEGLVQKIRNQNYTAGQEIDLGEPVRQRAAGWYRAAAAAAAISVLSGSGLYYAAENVFAYSTVTVTTDESAVELTLNKKDEVVSVKALDEESEAAIHEWKISFYNRKPLSDTIEEITDGQMQTSVSISSRNEERRQKLEEEMQHFLPPKASDSGMDASADNRNMPFEQNREVPDQPEIPADTEKAPVTEGETPIPPNGSGEFSGEPNPGPEESNVQEQAGREPDSEDAENRMMDPGQIPAQQEMFQQEMKSQDMKTREMKPPGTETQPGEESIQQQPAWNGMDDKQNADPGSGYGPLEQGTGQQEPGMNMPAGEPAPPPA